EERPGHARADTRGIIARLAFLDEADRAHDLTWRAEAALEPVMRDEGGLDGMELLAARYTLDREDVGTVMAECQRHAGIDSSPVDKDRAGAALAAVASLLRSGQVQTLTQKIEQCDARIRKLDVSPFTVNKEADGEVHAVIRSMLWSIVSRTERTAPDSDWRLGAMLEWSRFTR